MSWQQNLARESPEVDMELKQALGYFKASMDAWSDASLTRPRMAAKLAVRHTWRMATGWALGCAVVVGSLAGVAHVIVHRQELARITAQKTAQKTAEERAAAAPVTTQPEKKTVAATTRKVSAGAQDSASTQDENLLASVDSDVSRGVPAAMEPLAQLMDDNGAQ